MQSKKMIHTGMIVVLCLLTGCDNFTQEFKILRFPGIEASIGDKTYSTKDYTVRELGKTVGFGLDGSDSVTYIYNRYIIMGFLSADKVEKFELVFDVGENRENWSGIYTDESQPIGKWHEMRLVVRQKGNPDAFSVYETCDVSGGFLEITKQSTLEQIFSGEFEIEVCSSISSGKILMTGDFRDLQYASGGS